MASAMETAIGIGLAGTAIAIIAIPSFRQQVEAFFGGGEGGLDIPPIITGTESTAAAKCKSQCGSRGVARMTASGGCQCKVLEQDPSNIATMGGCMITGECYNHPSKPATCWRNIPCGGKTPVAWCISGRGRFTDARKVWLSKYGCKSKFAISYLSGYTAAHNPTENRISIS